MLLVEVALVDMVCLILDLVVEEVVAPMVVLTILLEKVEVAMVVLERHIQSQDLP